MDLSREKPTKHKIDATRSPEKRKLEEESRRIRESAKGREFFRQQEIITRKKAKANRDRTLLKGDRLTVPKSYDPPGPIERHYPVLVTREEKAGLLAMSGRKRPVRLLGLDAYPPGPGGSAGIGAASGGAHGGSTASRSSGATASRSTPSGGMAVGASRSPSSGPGTSRSSGATASRGSTSVGSSRSPSGGNASRDNQGGGLRGPTGPQGQARDNFAGNGRVAAPSPTGPRGPMAGGQSRFPSGGLLSSTALTPTGPRGPLGGNNQPKSPSIGPTGLQSLGRAPLGGAMGAAPTGLLAAASRAMNPAYEDYGDPFDIGMKPTHFDPETAYNDPSRKYDSPRIASFFSQPDLSNLATGKFGLPSQIAGPRYGAWPNPTTMPELARPYEHPGLDHVSFDPNFGQSVADMMSWGDVTPPTVGQPYDPLSSIRAPTPPKISPTGLPLPDQFRNPLRTPNFKPGATLPSYGRLPSEFGVKPNYVDLPGPLDPKLNALHNQNITRMVEAQRLANHPMTVYSGYRPATEAEAQAIQAKTGYNINTNAEAGGAKKSMHRVSAFDVGFPGLDTDTATNALSNAGFNRINFYPGEARRIHVDEGRSRKPYGDPARGLSPAQANPANVSAAMRAHIAGVRPEDVSQNTSRPGLAAMTGGPATSVASISPSPETASKAPPATGVLSVADPRSMIPSPPTGPRQRPAPSAASQFTAERPKPAPAAPTQLASVTGRKPTGPAPKQQTASVTGRKPTPPTQTALISNPPVPRQAPARVTPRFSGVASKQITPAELQAAMDANRPQVASFDPSASARRGLRPSAWVGPNPPNPMVRTVFDAPTRNLGLPQVNDAVAARYEQQLADLQRNQPAFDEPTRNLGLPQVNDNITARYEQETAQLNQFVDRVRQQMANPTPPSTSTSLMDRPAPYQPSGAWGPSVSSIDGALAPRQPIGPVSVFDDPRRLYGMQEPQGDAMPSQWDDLRSFEEQARQELAPGQAPGVPTAADIPAGPPPGSIHPKGIQPQALPARSLVNPMPFYNKDIFSGINLADFEVVDQPSVSMETMRSWGDRKFAPQAPATGAPTSISAVQPQQQDNGGFFSGLEDKVSGAVKTAGDILNSGFVKGIKQRNKEAMSKRAQMNRPSWPGMRLGEGNRSGREQTNQFIRRIRQRMAEQAPM